MKAIFLITALSINFLFSQIDSVYLHLPDSLYTTSESKFSVYYTNLIRGRFENKEQIIVNCEVGYPDSMKYNLDSLTAGIYKFNIQINDSNGLLIEESESNLIVTENEVNYSDTLEILMIGDSYTWSGIYNKHVKDLYANSNNMIKLSGSNFNSSSNYYGIDNQIFHEGYSGKSWFWFIAYEESPFVFDSDVDFDRYVNEILQGKEPHIITIFLGINDIGSGDPSSIETIDQRIDIIFTRMNILMSSIISSCPNTQIGIVLTPPTNERVETYTNPDLPDYFERKRMHHRLAQRYEDYFNNINNPRISVIPVNVNIDTFNGFGTTDSIHPNIFGYNQIGDSIYGWIKYQISRWMKSPINFCIYYENNCALLSWNEISEITLYKIYRSSDPFSGFEEIGTSTSNSFTDTNLNGSDRYFYHVTADNGLK
ncbi:MAG TPA: SGNH/GDSL hydrolase family protein [Clostridiales bacterium]|nr:SGNH/GDSL hydrolase family protein [Clostridiales bacterium]HQP69955.1 SGNH/GDSL hydrolase family protein [Clostridiales bacterium]